MKKNDYHEPVMVREVIEVLAPLKQAQIIDATVGTAGYTLALVTKGARVLGIEADREIYEVAKKRLEEACPPLNRKIQGSYTLALGNFRNIDLLAHKNNFESIEGVIFDLGVSNLQLTSDTRGFSFSNPDTELDMRISMEDQGLKAKDLLNVLREEQLVSLFAKVLTFRDSRYIAKKVTAQRGLKHFETVGDFLVALRGLKSKKGLHPGTLPFLALRMTVNSELENIKEALPKAFELLKKGGKLLVISFHSGERKVILDFWAKAQKDGRGRVVTQGPVVPREVEVTQNPRARSAELRIIEKV